MMDKPIEDWSHNDLKFDLRDARRDNGEIAVTELSLASWGSAGWVDVAAAKTSWTNFNITGYEIKRTRSDFMRDVQEGKYRRYLPFLHRFYFATPAGLLKRKEIPDGAGLIVRSEKGWSGVVAPRAMSIDDAAKMQICMAFMFRQNHAPWRTRDDSPRARAARIRKYRKHEKYSQILGQKMRKKIRDADRSARNLQNAKKKLGDILDINDAENYRITDLAQKLINREAGSDVVKEKIKKLVDRKMRFTKSGVERTLEKLEDLEEELREISGDT